MPLPPSASPTGTTAGSGWRLRLLGAVTLLDGAGHAVRLPSRAVALLLARLAMAPGRQHPREELVELLWPGTAGEVGRNRLRQALSVLRSLLEPAGTPAGAVLQADRRAVSLQPGAVRCDVTDFHEALRAGRPDRAAALHAGDLMPGYFEDWVQDDRRALAEAAARAGAAAGVAASVRGRAPLPEAAPRPLPPAPPPAAPDARLPQYLTRLVGFEADGAALAAAVPAHRLVVLRAPGGAGKTRLAIEVARVLALGAGWAGEPPAPAAPPFELVAFVSLVACSTAQQLHDAVLRAVQTGGGALAGGEPLIDALAGRRVLLLLDNFEQLVDVARADLARWLSRLPQLHLLVTSRRALGLDGEIELELSALALPDAGAALQVHAFNPAVTLFVDRARAARADFHLTERNHGVVADIVCALHGLPLAIELAAARVRSLGLADMHHMLVGNGRAPRPLELLARAGVRGGEDARHASMLAVLAWSWQQLGAPEQALLARLAVCDGGASLALLQHLSDEGAPATALRVDQLVAASVAYRRESAAGASRYHVFEPMRDYVVLQAGPGGLAALQALHARAVGAWAADLGREPALEEAAAEWPNLARALTTGASGDAAAAVQAIDTVLAARWALDDLPLTGSMLEQLRAIAAAAPGHRAAALHGLLAMQSFNLGQGAQSEVHAQAVTDHADRADPAELAEALRCAGVVWLRRDATPERAQAHLEQALAVAHAQGQPDIEARAITHLALVRFRRDRDGSATLPMYEQALALWRRHGPRPRATSGMVSLAVQLGMHRRVHEQLVLLDEARREAERTGQHRLLAFTMSVTGYALTDLRRLDEAAAMYRACLQMDWDQGHWREWFYVLWNLPRTLALQRRPEPAAQLMGFAEAFCAERFGQLGPEDLPEARRTRRLVRAQLGETRTATLWQAGARLSMAEAMALALARSA